jgi:protein-disulfide isomerase
MENHDIAEQMGINGTPTFIVAAIDGSYIDIVSGLPPGGTLEFLNGKFAEAVQAQ